MKNTALFEPQRLTKTICPFVLVFIPINMFFSPIFDFFTVEERGTNWTVTLSAFVFVLASMPLLAASVLSLKSRREKLFVRCMAVFFLYAFSLTLYLASDRFYPVYGLTSALGATLVGTVFYVAVRDSIISPRTVIYSLACAAVFVVMPLLLIQIDIERFAELSKGVGAANLLYGYENPRAVGWISTICLSMLAAHVSTQPDENRIRPVFLLLIIVSTAILFWSGSRGGLVAFTVSIAFVFSLSKTKNYKGLLSAISSACVGAAVSYFLYLPSQVFGLFGRIGQSLEEESIAAASSGRIEVWNKTIEYILERPFTGYGFLPHKSLEGFNHGSAHNIILDSWLWFGLIIGTLFILLGVLFWVTVFTFFRKANDHRVSALFCVVTTLLVYSMISGPYARTFPLLIFAIASGVLLGLRSSKGNAPQLRPDS
ncbi:O-antigen ligase family protein [Yoonia sp. GPGPB17]|uniref:O-antigen ligase family protein n=1 Tax=Yoonia sp. GPGPB17 TaxID=3026147 RepID=UPI0030BDD92C